MAPKERKDLLWGGVREGLGSDFKKGVAGGCSNAGVGIPESSGEGGHSGGVAAREMGQHPTVSYLMYCSW